MAASTISSLLRTHQAYCQQVCEKQTLDYGIAFTCARFPAAAEVNQFREVVAPNESLPAALTQVDHWFAEQGLVCRRWVPAADQPPEPIDGFLTQRGFSSRSAAALLLTRWVDLAPDPEVRVLPARAMRVAFQQAALAAAKPGEGAECDAEVLQERLDDPQLDMFVALVDKKPAGYCGLHQVGDIARVTVPTVAARFESAPVAAALLAHVVALAKRLAMRTVCAQVDAKDGAALRLFANSGFVHDGDIVEFDRQAMQ